MSNIENSDLKKTIPLAIKENKDIQTLSTLIEKELQQINTLISKNHIFANIESLDEKTLDILAYDLNILWYDYTYKLDIKREIIKDCIKIYRKLGTPYAVKKALGNIFPDTTLKEWYETNDEPYTFTIEINASKNGASKNLQALALQKIRYYKNLRSHLKKLTYLLERKTNIHIGTATTLGGEIKVYPYTKRTITNQNKPNFTNGLIYGIEVIVTPCTAKKNQRT